MSGRYNSRPSQLLNVKDAYIAWCLDEAVFTYGYGVEALLKQAEAAAPTDQHRPQVRAAKLHQLLSYDPAASVKPTDDGDTPVPAPKGRFADPALLVGSGRVKRRAAKR